MAIREVDLGLEAVYGTAATTFVFMRCDTFDFKNVAPLDKPHETSGTAIPLQRPRPGARQGQWTAKVYLYYDMSCYWLALAMGVPAVSGVGGAAGVFKNTFMPGGSAIKSATLRWKQASSAGTLWWQATGCKVKTVKPVFDAKGLPMLELSGFGKYAINISAPGSPPADTTAAYTQPVGMGEQTLTLSAIAWSLVRKMSLSVDNGIAPDWTLAASRDFSRIKTGDVVVGGDGDAFFDSYAGSIETLQDSATSLMGAVVWKATDPTILIGTGTPVPPSCTITVPKPYAEEDTTDFTNTDTMEKFKIAAAYDATTTSNIKFDLVNDVLISTTMYNGT